ncbi:hypothetical protein [Caldibacillus thermoamylovorans]|uniref:hypothetical protein n=1 Tax=Caldibacillus thermoamylovorans TaxID=35841 RepID=UPI0020404B6E|nr:hypothetical protein [Caldibacillus thermoamylovorans]MCM3477482.1 hypothetical protein [Caldibacillus thermoamylovorans]
MTWLISDGIRKSFIITKLATRKGLFVKKRKFPLQIGNEIEARRQKWVVFGSKRRREQGSSPKLRLFHLKMVTRIGLVAKNSSFSPQNGDEIRPRRQN